MADTIEKPLDAGYDDDFYLWTQQQAERLRAAARNRINAPIDWEKLAEEIESLGQRDKREAGELVCDIACTLLLLKTSSTNDLRQDWREELQRKRFDLQLILDDSPSLKMQLGQIVEEEVAAAYDLARNRLEILGDQDALMRLDRLRQSETDVRQILDEDNVPERLAS